MAGHGRARSRAQGSLIGGCRLRRGTMAALVVMVFAGCGGCGGASAPSTPGPMSGPWYCSFIRCEDGGIVTPGPRCSPATCNGCCDVNGLCQRGNTDVACGQGQACTNCASFAGRCIFNGCVVLDEPAPCSAANCGGCCTAEGFCNPGTASTSCGPRGTICTACAPGFGCERQQCVRQCGASNCSGCCDGNAVCVQGLSDSACGRGGDACQRCEPWTTCRSSGRCVERPTCSTCTDGQCCLNGSCVGTAAELCATTGVPNAACRVCPAPAACGGGTERGFCVNAGTRPLGAPCLWDGECAAGAGTGRPTCLIGPGWPNGYCSDACTTAACAAPDLCWNVQSQNVCLKGCSTPGTSCGDAGTVCDLMGDSTSSACLPRCTPATAAFQCASARCSPDGRCCGASGNTCCATSSPCTGAAADGGVAACLPNGRCS